MIEIYCKCGCGKRIGHQKAKKGRVFLNKKHSAIYRERNKKQKKEATDSFWKRKINYNLGTDYCKKYNNDDIKCVVCYEQELKNTKGCFE